jgi:hypothetical protein
MNYKKQKSETRDDNGNMICVGDRVAAQIYIENSKGIEKIKDFGVVIFKKDDYYIILDKIFILLSKNNKEHKFKMQVKVKDTLSCKII